MRNRSTYNFFSGIVKIVLFAIFVLSTVPCFTAQTVMYAYGMQNMQVASNTLVSIGGSFIAQPRSGVDVQFDNLGTLQVSGDLLNNNASANIFLNNTSGTVVLNGTSAQTIGGGTAIDLYDLSLNNTSGLTNGIMLSGDATVNGSLNLTNGVIRTTSSDVLTLKNGATTTIGNNASYINGPMEYEMGVSSSRILYLPLGKDNDWRPVELTPTHGAATTYTYTAELFNGNANTLYTVPAAFDNVSYVHYYHIQRSSAANLTGALIKMYYSATDGTPDYVNDASNLGMAKDNGAGSWSNISSGAGSADYTGNITSASFTSFSYFSLGNLAGGSNPLPIELLSFTAKANPEQKVDLKWSTATEVNNDYFTIDRSTDGINFEFVTSVKSASGGNSSVQLDYTTVDNTPYKGVSYYRLKQTDFDGKFTYSQIVPVTIDEGFLRDIALFPNPSSQFEITQLSITSLVNKEVLVIVTDVTGKEIYTKVVLLEKDVNQLIAIDPDHKLTPGVYSITATSDDSINNRKLVIR